MERVQFISHQGKKILLIDYTNCSAAEMKQIATTGHEAAKSQPQGSVLQLVDLSGAQFSREEIAHIKKIAALNRPYIKRSAIVGAQTFPKAVWDGIKAFSVRDFKMFDTRPKALEWLTREEIGQWPMAS